VLFNQKDYKGLNMNDITSILKKLNDIKSEVTSISKDGTIEMKGGRRYDVVTHDNVSSLMQPLFVKHGVHAQPTQDSTEKWQETILGKYGESKLNWVTVDITMTFYCVETGQSLSSNWSADANDSGDKAKAKAMSMAVKNAYLKTFCIPSGDNEEERSEEKISNGNSGVNLDLKWVGSLAITFGPNEGKKFGDLTEEEARVQVAELRKSSTEFAQKAEKYLIGKFQK
jgi:hypothetical protein